MGFGFKSARHTATARSAQKLSTLPVVCLQAVAGHLDDARVVVALGSSPEAREALRLGVAAARAAAAAAANKKRRELEQEAAERWWNEVHPRIQAMQNGEPLPPHYPSIMELVTMARREMRPQMPYRKGLQVAVWGFFRRIYDQPAAFGHVPRGASRSRHHPGVHGRHFGHHREVSGPDASKHKRDGPCRAPHVSGLLDSDVLRHANNL